MSEESKAHNNCDEESNDGVEQSGTPNNSICSNHNNHNDNDKLSKAISNTANINITSNTSNNSINIEAEDEEEQRVAIHLTMVPVLLTRNMHLLAQGLVLAAIVLCGLWASKDNKPNNSNDNNSNNNDNDNNGYGVGYLGKPSFTFDRRLLFPWHPLLMVTVFFSSIVIAITSWNNSSGCGHNKLRHVMFQLTGLIGLVLGLYCVFAFNSRDPHLTSLHSWIGVITISLFAINMLSAVARELYKYCLRSFSSQLIDVDLLNENINESSQQYFNFHRLVGCSLVAVATLSIATGITNFLEQETCNVATDSEGVNIPEGCRLANWMGLVVVLSMLCTILSVVMKTQFARL